MPLDALHHNHHNSSANPLREVVVGAIAGVGAAFVMDQFQSAWIKYGDKLGVGSGPSSGGGEPSTVKAADLVAEDLTRSKVPDEYREQAGQAVHYATGAALGALYGVFAASVRGATLAHGLVFGALTYKVLDEGLVPQLRLGPPAEQTDRQTEIYGLVSHLVFGFATYSFRKMLGGR